jgi:predicted dienelactone hydrolase
LLSLLGFLFSKIKRPYWINILPALALFFIVIHLIFIKYQWQMIPLYILTIILSTIMLVNIIKVKQAKTKISKQNDISKPSFEKPILDKSESRKFKISRYILTILGLLYLIISAFILFLFPIVNLPKPTGDYAVGTTFMTFVDPNRPEIFTEDTADHREFIARVWYPTDAAIGSPMIYRKNIPQIGLIESGGAPNFIFGHYNLIKTNSYLDAPISNQQSMYPVLIFSNGFLAAYDDYQLLMEELASHGYIVFSLNQPYESQSVIYSNKKIVPFSEEHLKNYQQEQKITLPLWTKFWASTNENEKNEIAKQILDNAVFMDTILRERTSDIQFAINEMEKINSGQRNDIFTNRLDLSSLGILGHSMGGAVAGQVCLIDNRFKAGVNMDGFQFGDVIHEKIQQPFMIMYSEQFSGVNNFVFNQFKNKLYTVTIKDSKHMNFDDNQIIMPSTKFIGMTGKIDANKMRTITNSYILSFFDKYLKNNDAPFPDDVLSNYPEVVVKIN